MPGFQAGSGKAGTLNGESKKGSVPISPGLESSTNT